jgi:hypothetical protein
VRACPEGWGYLPNLRVGMGFRKSGRGDSVDYTGNVVSVRADYAKNSDPVSNSVCATLTIPVGGTTTCTFARGGCHSEL